MIRQKIMFVLLGVFILLFVSVAVSAQKQKTCYSPKLQELYDCVDNSCSVKSAESIKPRIGITVGGDEKQNVIRYNYVQSIIAQGAVPVFIPMTTDLQVLREIVAGLDGIMFTGGDDFAPEYFGETASDEIAAKCSINATRDANELSLLKLADNRNLPILGICRGCQLINVGFGGTLYQDIPIQHGDRGVAHRQTLPAVEPSHSILIKKGSVLSSLIGDEVEVNSFHHQAVKTVAPGFTAVAIASDSIVEAIEGPSYKNILGVQFHPEYFYDNENSKVSSIFACFVKKASLYSQAKKIHSHILSLDSHTDAPLDLVDGLDMGERNEMRTNLPKMQEGQLDGQFYAAWVAQKQLTPAGRADAKTRVIQLIGATTRQVEKYKNICEIVSTADDARRIKANGKKAIYLAIENGYALGLDLNNVNFFKKMGVQYITLCHTRDNDICHSSSSSQNSKEGLTAFGEKVVREMNRLGIIVDLSHANEATFYDVLKLSSRPVICSHSSARALCDHDRNLTDEQLRALAAHGGVAQMCVVDEFLNTNHNKANLDDAIAHIEHMVNVAGIDHVGIGSDFDGGGGVPGINSDSDMINITMRLIEKGYTEEMLAKLWGGNLLRVMSAVQR